MQMNEMIKQFQNIFLIDLSLKPSIVLKINDAIPNSEKNTVAYVIEHYSAIAKNLSSNERQDLRKALKEVGVPDGLLPGKGRPKTEPSKKRDYWPHSITESEEEVKESLGITQEEPKESALKESVEQVKESVKVLTDHVKDAASEIISRNATVEIDDDGAKVRIEGEDAKEFFDSPLFEKVKRRFDQYILFGDMNVNDAIEQLKEINEEIRRLEAIREEYKEYIVDRLDEV